jgi:hypothetical protein
MGKKRRKAAVVAALMAAPACGHPAAHGPPALHADSQAEVDAAVLWRGAPTAKEYAFRTIYTWTTAEQVEQLKAGGKLLVREESPELGLSYFEQYVRMRADAGDSIAQLLDTTTFAKQRFGWTHPWATRLGYAGESYGDQLIGVTLRDDAYVLFIKDNGATMEAQMFTGTSVLLADVRAHPERIGAVYFVTGSFREYVLCNEAMIESWSVGTTDVTSLVALESAALDQLAHEVRASPSDMEVVRPLYNALAFTGSGFAPTPEHLEQIAKALRASTARAVVEGKGTTTFAGIGPRRPPPKVRPAPPRNGPTRGTY